MKFFKKINFFKRKSQKRIKYRPIKSNFEPPVEFKRNIYTKAIIQSIKKLKTDEITISTENIYDDIPLLENLFKKNTIFSIGNSEQAYQTAEYFLCKYGMPVSILTKVKSGVYVYLGGERILTSHNVPTVDLTNNNIEYIIKGVQFPVKIMSFSVLFDALQITNKKLSDIIIKPCIILRPDE